MHQLRRPHSSAKLPETLPLTRTGRRHDGGRPRSASTWQGVPPKPLWTTWAASPRLPSSLTLQCSAGGADTRDPRPQGNSGRLRRRGDGGLTTGVRHRRYALVATASGVWHRRRGSRVAARLADPDDCHRVVGSPCPRIHRSSRMLSARTADTGDGGPDGGCASPLRRQRRGNRTTYGAHRPRSLQRTGGGAVVAPDVPRPCRRRRLRTCR